MQPRCREDILYVLAYMKTDRYKKIELIDRSARQSTVDGLGLARPLKRGKITYRSDRLEMAPLVQSEIEPTVAHTVRVSAPPRPPHHTPYAQHSTRKRFDSQPVSFRQQYRSGQQEPSEQDTTMAFPLPAYIAPKRPRLVVGKRKKARRAAMRMVTGMVALMVVVGGLVGWRGYTAAGRVLSGTTTVAALSSNKVTPTLLKGEGDGRVNVLLLGVGGAGHDGGDLTDTMVVASIDPVNHQVSLLSIPRDLWVKMAVNYYGSSQKINAAYSAGKYQYLGKADVTSSDPLAIQAGLASVDSAVSQVLGISIDYHVLVNFTAFAQAIDTVDGVTVNVEKPLVDASMAWENNNNATLMTAGQQQMNGKAALLYARSRHSTSDFDRAERQRQLLVALKQKVLTLETFSNPVKLEGLADTFGKNVYSDLSTKAALRLYDIMKKIDDKNVHSLDLVTAPHSFITTDTVGDISVVRPKLGFDAYSDIQTYVRSQLRDGYLVRENAQVAVVATTQASAEATRTILSDYGYNAKATVVAVTIDKATVVDLTDGRAPYTRNYLEKRYNTKATAKLPVGIVVPAGTQFAILVDK